LIKHIYDESGMILLRTEEATPVCQTDFCDRCGDCLACSDDQCLENGEHFWVQYGETPEKEEHGDS